MRYSTWFFPSSSFHSKSCIQQMMITSCFFFYSPSRATGGLWTDSARYCKGGRRRQPPTRLYIQWKEERFFRYPSAEIYTVKALFWSHYLRPRKCTVCVFIPADDASRILLAAISWQANLTGWQSADEINSTRHFSTDEPLLYKRKIKKK